MKNHFFVISIVLLIIWGVGFFILGCNPIIHILIIIAIISSLLGILSRSESN